MAQFIASFEVDQRQRLILQADKLREMLGASRLIERTVEIAEEILAGFARHVALVTPVSGVLRFTADDLKQLAAFLWKLRMEIVEGLHLPSTTTILQAKEGEPFKSQIDRLEERVRLNKDSRTGSAGRPSSPLFAQCLIQPQLSATHWRPEEFRKGEVRRSLLSEESKQREKESDDTYSRQFNAFAKLKDFRKNHGCSWWEALPKEFSQLADSVDDSYFAFIKADGDGMGRLLMNLDWDGLRPGQSGAQSCLAFSRELERCLEEATRQAVDKVTADWTFQPKGSRFPVAPLVRAGEDYWIVCRREKALALAMELGDAYARLMEQSEIIKAGRERVLKDETLSLSFGILFAKQGFPFEAQLRMAEALIKNAKQFRRDSGAKQGCVDYYWLESSAREDVIPYRATTQTIADGGERYQLYSAPWTLEESRQFVEAAQEIADSAVASRKLNQLETILRLGTGFSDLAYDQWLKMLTQEDLDKVTAALKKLPPRFKLDGRPFCKVGDRWVTPLLDLLKMVDILEVKAPQKAAATA